MDGQDWETVVFKKKYIKKTVLKKNKKKNLWI
jgi:hypothetical protein